MTKKYIYIILICLLAACSPRPKDVEKSESLPPIYPDYAGVTIPENIAPLNFLLRDSCDAVFAVASCGDVRIESGRRGCEVVFPIKEWKKLAATASGKEIKVVVSARYKGRWVEYKDFSISVSGDRIDPYLTYRLIEPDYEVFSRLSIMERNIEGFSERSICDYEGVGNRCMNCHTHAPGKKDLSFLFVRGEGGGMILNDHGNVRKLKFNTDDMVSGPVYAQFDPNGRYIVFSSNKIIPAFHSSPDKRLEVFDTKSDVYVYDLKKEKLLATELLADSTHLETFPAFSADGGSIYFCRAQGDVAPGNIENLHYSLCRIDFDPTSGKFGRNVETIVMGNEENGSVSHPRVSPDGRFLLYTVSGYGTFPIWHREADLRMLELATGRIDSLVIVNSPMSDTYHTWSSSGRWFVFASKRDDGLYGKPYFAHVSPDGRVSKPFLLPQESPGFYDLNLKSFNVPDLGQAPVSFTPDAISVVGME